MDLEPASSKVGLEPFFYPRLMNWHDALPDRLEAIASRLDELDGVSPFSQPDRRDEPHNPAPITVTR